MKTLKQLTIDLGNARRVVSDIKDTIELTSDGFQYIIGTHCYGSFSLSTHINYVTAREHVDSYYGDNGLVDVYTNNPNFKPDDQGGLRQYEYIDTEDLDSAVKELLLLEEE
tara:strand:- start:299 stop:631 length:333 start_codon:yes stop_codon:yes gene_type:complete